MFRKNTKHQQPALISAASELPEKQRTRLANSWAGTRKAYREFFRRLNEEAFAELYSDLPSRPNVPVNVLVGLEALKAGFGWSDAELYSIPPRKLCRPRRYFRTRMNADFRG